MSAQKPLRSEILPAPHIHEDSRPCGCAFAATRGTAKAYNEEAFRYFLNIESKRAERSGQPLMLVLVDEKGQSSAGPGIDAGLSEQLFVALSHGLRETDFFGWYQEHRVVGAVLMQRSDASGTDASLPVRERVGRIIAQHLPSALTARLQVRVFQLPSKPKGSR